MYHEQKKLAIRACVCVSVFHVGVDIARLLSPESHALELFHELEPAMLAVSTFALAIHLVLERAIFDWILAAAHATNLTIGWFGTAINWFTADHALHQLHWFPTVAGLALAIAALATFAEVAGLRHSAQRTGLVCLAVSLALCFGMTRDGINEVALPPRESTSRATLLARIG